MYFCLNCLLFDSVYIYIFLYILFILSSIYIVYSIYQRKCRFTTFHICVVYTFTTYKYIISVKTKVFKQLEFYKLVKPNPREVREFIAC